MPGLRYGHSAPLRRCNKGWPPRPRGALSLLIQDEWPVTSFVDDITVAVGRKTVTFGEPGDSGLPRR